MTGVRVAALACAAALMACAPNGITPNGSPATPVTSASSTGFSYTALRDDGTPVRWNPCAAIAWTTRPSDPAWFATLVEEALAATAPHVGLRFRQVPPGAATLGDERSMTDDGRWAPVLFTLATRAEATWLRDDDLGLAVPVFVAGQYVTAQLVFGSWHELQVGFADAATHWGGPVLHEIGHLVGLAHVQGRGELMTARAGHQRAQWGDGDLRGLDGLASLDGCLVTPPARDWPWPTVSDAARGPGS